MKSYLDFNDGWPESSWEISEPAIYYQAAYIRLLANYVSGIPTSTGVFRINKSEGKIAIISNPATDFISLKLDEGNYFVTILDTAGKNLMQLNYTTGEKINIIAILRFSNKIG